MSAGTSLAGGKDAFRGRRCVVGGERCAAGAGCCARGFRSCAAGGGGVRRTDTAGRHCRGPARPPGTVVSPSAAVCHRRPLRGGSLTLLLGAWRRPRWPARFRWLVVGLCQGASPSELRREAARLWRALRRALWQALRRCWRARRSWRVGLRSLSGWSLHRPRLRREGPWASCPTGVERRPMLMGTPPRMAAAVRMSGRLGWL